MNRRFGLGALAVAAVLCGSALGLAPGLGLATIATLAVAGVTIQLLIGRPADVRVVAVLLGIHLLNVIRLTVTNDWLGEIPRRVRIPAVLLVCVLLLTIRWRALFLPIGRAATAVPLLFVGWLFIASSVGVWPERALFQTTGVLVMFLTIGLAISWYDDVLLFWERWCTGLVWIGATLLPLSLLAAALGMEWASQDRWVLGTEAIGYRGIMIAANHLGAMGCMTAGAALVVADRRAGEQPRWLLPLLLIAGSSVLASASRGAMIGFSSGMGWYLLRGARRPGAAKLARRLALVAAVSVLIGIGLTQSNVGKTQIGRFAETPDLVRGGSAPRTVVWRTYGAAFLERPMTGLGFGVSAVDYDIHARRLVGGEARAHNVLIEYGLTSGVLGLILFLWLATGIVRGLSGPEGRPLLESVALFFAMTWPIYLLQTAGSGMNEIGAWPFWIPLLLARANVASASPDGLADPGVGAVRSVAGLAPTAPSA